MNKGAIPQLELANISLMLIKSKQKLMNKLIIKCNHLLLQRLVDQLIKMKDLPRCQVVILQVSLL